MSQPQFYPGPDEHQKVYPSGDPKLVPAPPQDVVDFASQRERPTFRIGQEVFYGKIEIPALPMMRYSIRATAMDSSEEEGLTEESLNMTLDMLRLMLQKESSDRLFQRLEDEENPIGMDTFNKLIPWLMEQYGMRPTEPSSDSAPGSPNPDDGNSSTENGQGPVF